MLYIVCYDRADEPWRARVAGTLVDFGRRLEESVFAVHLDKELTATTKRRLERRIKESGDTLHFFPLRAARAEKMEVMTRGE